MKKKLSRVKKTVISIAVLAGVVVLCAFLFYRIYLYSPEEIAIGGKLDNWSVSFQSGMLVVNKNYTFPEGCSQEEIRNAMTPKYDIAQSEPAN